MTDETQQTAPTEEGDGTRGPEWERMEARHAAEGVIRWHVDRAPGVTDEQIAAAMNETADYLSIPQNDIAARLDGEAFCLRDDAECTLNRVRCTSEGIVPVEITKMERVRAESKIHLANLLTEAANLLRESLRPVRFTREDVEKAARIIDPFGWDGLDTALRPYKENRGARGITGEQFWYGITWGQRGFRTEDEVRHWFLSERTEGKEGDWPPCVFGVRESLKQAAAILAAIGEVEHG